MLILKINKPTNKVKQAPAAPPASRDFRPDKLRVQIARYIFFGAFSTAADFAILNLCVYVLHVPIVWANLLSISASLLAGYATNQKLVFRNSEARTKRHFIYYVIVTLIGLYGLQSGVLVLLSHYPLAQNAISGFVATTITHAPIGPIEANIAKLLATIASSIWGFIACKKLVFVYNQH
ncbi:MAG: GtrA family protein [Candidatus Saccharimonadales bacterium]